MTRKSERSPSSSTRPNGRSAGSSSTNRDKTHLTTDTNLSSEDKRRRRNVESARRHKQRMKNEYNWMKVQTDENAQRIKQLERTVQDLTMELARPSEYTKHTKPRPGGSHNDARPSWFGEPF